MACSLWRQVNACLHVGARPGSDSPTSCQSCQNEQRYISHGTITRTQTKTGDPLVSLRRHAALSSETVTFHSGMRERDSYNPPQAQLSSQRATSPCPYSSPDRTDAATAPRMPQGAYSLTLLLRPWPAGVQLPSRAQTLPRFCDHDLSIWKRQD